MDTKKLQELSEPIIKMLQETANPYTHIVVGCDGVRIVNDVKFTPQDSNRHYDQAGESTSCDEAFETDFGNETTDEQFRELKTVLFNHVSKALNSSECHTQTEIEILPGVLRELVYLIENC